VLQKPSPHDEQQRELLDRAMKALKPRSTGVARDRTMLIAKGYKELIGLSRRAKKFSGLGTELKWQATQARKLAQCIEETLAETELALYSLLGAGQELDDSFRRRVKLMGRLKAFAKHTDSLTALPSWPRGGRRNIATGFYRSPHKWLAYECLRTFFSFGMPDDIQVTSPQKPSRFGQYAEAVYELATGTTPDDSGLEKALNETVRAYRKNQA